MTFGGHEVGEQLQQYDLVERGDVFRRVGNRDAPDTRTAGDRNWEAKETRRRGAGSIAEVWALEELDERTIANALIKADLVTESRLQPIEGRPMRDPAQSVPKPLPKASWMSASLCCRQLRPTFALPGARRQTTDFKTG